MKAFVCAVLLLSTSLYAEKAPFASQSDLLVDLSDGILNGIYHHRPGFDRYPCERSVWVEGFGSYRKRESSSDRMRYENSLGGIVAGFNFSLSCENYLNFFVGGSWGELEFCHESNFDTESIFFGLSWEKFCGCRFFGLALASGYLGLERHHEHVHEEPRGVFIAPEITYAQELDYFYCYPIFSATLRYAGFFSRDYQHRETEGTLYVQDRSIQLFTLRGELAAPIGWWQPYLGVA
ncbi:MAG: hypothetical protein K940chlam9_00614, partial [Chlamydiae bacterium]|nr:hypothetical protein [Chlamydiota bacterium]